MGGRLGLVVVVVVGVVWAASLQGLARPQQSPRWTFLSHAPTRFEEQPWRVESVWPVAEHYHEQWDYPRWLQELRSLEPRLQQVLAPLTYRVHKRGRASGTGPEGGDGNKETTDAAGWSQAPAGWAPANKRGIGLFSLAIALAQKPTSAPEPMMHPADLSAYPRRARFFVATMG